MVNHFFMPQVVTANTIAGEPLHGWQVLEYERHQRGRTWYIVMTILGLLLVGYGMITSNFLFSLIIILAGIILFLQAHEEAGQVPFFITELGIVVASRFYPYTELHHFYIIYQPPEIKTLFIQHKSALRPLLRIPLMDQNPVEVRHTLLNFLEEDLEKEQEPTSETIARRWKLH